MVDLRASAFTEAEVLQTDDGKPEVDFESLS